MDVSLPMKGSVPEQAPLTPPSSMLISLIYKDASNRYVSPKQTDLNKIKTISRPANELGLLLRGVNMHWPHPLHTFFDESVTIHRFSLILTSQSKISPKSSSCGLMITNIRVRIVYSFSESFILIDFPFSKLRLPIF